MKQIRTAVGLSVLAIFVAALVAACGGDNPGVAYQPAAFGEQTVIPAGMPYYTMSGQPMMTAAPMNSFVCYVSDSYLEVTLLHAAGLCPDLSVAIVMATFNKFGAGPVYAWNQPLLWHQMYAPYYDSYAYYGRYVPPAQRQVYVQHVTVFEQHYHNEIVQQESSNSAHWKGTDGRKYSGSQVGSYVKSGKATFGGGSVRSQPFASQAMRATSAPAAAKPASAPTYKTVTVSTPRPANSSRPYSGGSGSGGLFGGGGGRTGSGSSGKTAPAVPKTSGRCC